MSSLEAEVEAVKLGSGLEMQVCAQQDCWPRELESSQSKGQRGILEQAAAPDPLGGRSRLLSKREE